MADKEYFLFANLCDVVFVILGGLSALIFGTELIKNFKGGIAASAMYRLFGNETIGLSKSRILGYYRHWLCIRFL